MREIERKYDPGAGGAAVLDAVKAMTGTAGVAAVSQQPEQLLDAVYYDTADLRLIRAGVTLRRRSGGEDAGWHLKLPAGADTRDEIRLPLTGPASESAARTAPRSVAKRAAIHQARKATKRARYVVEAAIPALGGRVRRQAAQARELRQLLGDHHDSVVARTVLLELAEQARAAGEDTFTYGLLHQRQACQAAAIEQALPHLDRPRSDGP